MGRSIHTAAIMSARMKKQATKRKRDDGPSVPPAQPPQPPSPPNLNLSDSEEESAASEGEESDPEPFPEINEAAASEDADSADEDAVASDGESDRSYLIEDSDFVDSLDSEDEAGEGSVNIGPKAKIITSNITGRPKRVYPEIEPDYDSDSSTEEVRVACHLFLLNAHSSDGNRILIG